MYGVSRIWMGGALGVLGFCLVALGPLAAAQPPETILIQGQLRDAAGDPLPGLRQYRVRFFDAETGGTQLGGDLVDFTLVNAEGLFAFPVTAPQAALEAPELWYELALDSAPIPDGVDPEDVFADRVRVHSVPFALNALRAAGLHGESFVMVQTTADPAQNGANLLAAYAEAAAMTPHGEALGPENRAVVIVPPGRYDLGSGQLALDTEFVDLVGLTTARDDQHIFGTADGPGTGVLRQTANNVRIENLLVECKRGSGGVDNNASDPAAYYPDSNLPDTVLRNCRFVADDSNARSMRVAIEYAGTYEDIAAGTRAFGGEGGTASGTFINCSGGFRAFGGNGGTASGTFINCDSTTGAFGGQGGVASGTFTNCTGGNSAFGGGSGGVASGTFTNCTGGPWAFGGQGEAPGGTFYYCVGGLGAFGTSGSPAPEHLYCVRDGVAFP